MCWQINLTSNSQRLGGLMSMTDSVGAAVGLGLGSMSLPLRGLLAGPGASSRSGVKTLLPLLVLGDCSVGLKLTGERKPWTCVRRARGKVFLPAEQRKRRRDNQEYSLNHTAEVQRNYDILSYLYSHIVWVSLRKITHHHCSLEGRRECHIVEGKFHLSLTSQTLGCRTLQRKRRQMKNKINEARKRNYIQQLQVGGWKLQPNSILGLVFLLGLSVEVQQSVFLNLIFYLSAIRMFDMF